MRIATRRWVRRAVPLVLAGGIIGSLLPNAFSAPAPAISEGMVCTTEANNTFSITARSGYVSTPDGNSIYMWSYSIGGASFQFPGPTLCVDSGTPVTIVLRNTLPEDTSLVFPGQQHVKANGHATQPQFDMTNPAAPVLTSLSDGAAKTNGTVTYTFNAGSPGTYLYTTGSDVAKQQQMGLYGALIVRPPGAADHANSRADSKFSTDRQFLMLMSEVDPAMHLAVERGQAFDVTTIKSKYFMINGRSMPDTIAPNYAGWLPNQPYGGLVHIKPLDPVKYSGAAALDDPNRTLIRFLNAGSTSFPFHPHGSSEKVLNRDGQALQNAAGADGSYDRFGINVGPGQSLDALETWANVENWNAATNPVPVPLPQLQDQIVGPGTQTWFSESPYLGGKVGEIPAGMVQNNQCGEYYHVAHSHALQQATNYGASFGGMMTLIRIDPPAGCPAK
jgi:FtsP/CotA-like multicopper oxidase with cupredoxin domain